MLSTVLEAGCCGEEDQAAAVQERRAQWRRHTITGAITVLGPVKEWYVSQEKDGRIRGESVRWG